jgi:hypothetical protein
MTPEECVSLINDLESRGWKCVTNNRETLDFVLTIHEKLEWHRVYNKSDARFVQFNGKQVINVHPRIIL